jgi:DNA-binding CsgD family transcriptional regulator
MGVLSNGFAHVVVHDASKISIEKGAEGQCLLRAREGLINWEVLRRNPLDLITVNTYITRTNKTITQFQNELFSDLPSIRKWLDDLAKNIFRFTSKQIDDFVLYSTKQGSQS